MGFQNMAVVHFVENNSVVLSQLLANVPAVDENIKIKGRKGKVLKVIEIDENNVQVFVSLEKLNKKQQTLVDNKKKKR